MMLGRWIVFVFVLLLSPGPAAAQESELKASSDRPDQAATVFEDAVEAHVERVEKALDARLAEVAAGHGAEDLSSWIELELETLRWIEAKARSGRHSQAQRRLGPLLVRLEDAAQRTQAFRDPQALSREIERALRSKISARVKLGGGGISGRVTDHLHGTPLADTAVVLRSLGTDLLQTVVTDETGYYELTDVAPGMYHVHTQSMSHRNESYDDRPCVSYNCQVFYYTVEFSAGHPVTVESGTVTQSIDFALDPEPMIRGRVVHSETGEPRQGALIKANGISVGDFSTAMTDADGYYELQRLGKGHFAVTAFSGPLMGELYEDVPCYQGLTVDCFTHQATLVFTDFRLPAEGIDFALSPGSGLEGRISDEVTGIGIPFARVAIYQPDGEVFTGTTADENGRFGVALPAGTYHVRADASPYVIEQYDDVSCGNSQCEPNAGTPVVISEGAVISGVDLELETGGSVSGTVRDRLGNALAGIPIRAYDADGFIRGLGRSSPDGSYSMARLAAGSYFAVAYNAFQQSWTPQVYQGLPCPAPYEPPCPLDGATPIAVSAGQDTSGIDFALVSRRSVSGRVLDGETGAPIPNAAVSLYRDDGVFLSDVFTDDEGFYRHRSVTSPIYLLVTAEDFVPQAFSGLPCPPQDCDPTLGNAIELMEHDELINMDAQLRRGGGVEGIVRLGGEPLAQAAVSAYDHQGRVVATVESDSEGRYRVGGLLDGQYFMTMEYHGWTQIYPNRDCRSGCPDPRTGEPVTIADSTTQAGVDFNLARRAVVFGRITDAFDRPLSGADVWLRDLVLDELVASQTTGGDGLFRFEGLSSGSYRLSSDKTTYDFTSLEPILVQEASGPTEVHLRLEHHQGISGRVVAAGSGLPVPLVAIDIWDENGELYSQGLTSADGHYSVSVPDGLWYVSTDNGRGGLDKVYPEALCPTGPVIAGACDPRTGEPVAVDTELVEGIDFVLDGIDVFDCIPSDTVLCLNGGRFRVETVWRNAEGLGTPGQRGLLTNDSAYFWFFDDANIEVLVKVLDACSTASKRYWVFAAGLTNVDVSLVVTDTATGRSKEYRNPADTNFQPILDTDAFNSCDARFQGSQAAEPNPQEPPTKSTVGPPTFLTELEGGAPKTNGSCEPGDEHLCLSGNRFQAELTYRVPQSPEQTAPAVQLTDESGYFWFFDARNIEVMVKVLDACYPPFDRFWVFSAGLTNLEVELRVTDTVSGEVRTYNNPADSPFAPIFDISAFDTCD